MSSVLIVPRAELGHILPTLAITRRLTSQGHQVVYLTAPQFSSYIHAVGGTIQDLIPQTPDGSYLSGAAIWSKLILDYVIDSSGSQFDRLLRSLADRDRFSLVLFDRDYVRKHRDLMKERIGADRILYFSTSLFPWDFQGLHDQDVPEIVLCPAAFEVEKFRRSEYLTYVEPSIRPVETDLDGFFLTETSRPIVLAAFGSQGAIYENLHKKIELIREVALRQPQLQFLLSTGLSEDRLAEVADYQLPNLVMRAKLPQRFLLGHASAMITHGGLGSIKEAIFHGVPLIVLPMVHDQPYNAMRVRCHGLGEALFPDYHNVEALESAVCGAVGGRYSDNVAMMQSLFVAMEKTHPSQHIIERFLT